MAGLFTFMVSVMALSVHILEAHEEGKYRADDMLELHKDPLLHQL